MLFKKGKEITNILKGKVAIAAIYRGAQLVWEAINSCFGKGFWVNIKPWSNIDAWKNKN